jgi:hypothetical protein
MEPAGPSPLALPEHAWGAAPIRWRSPTVRPFVAAAIAGYGLLGVIGSLLMSLEDRWFGGIIPVPSWLSLPDDLLTIALGIAVLRNRPSAVRRVLSAVLLSKALWNVCATHASSPYGNATSISVAYAIAWTCLGIGVWRATEWGRRGCTLIGIAVVTYSIVSDLRILSQFAEEQPASALFAAIAASIAFVAIDLPYLALAAYGVLPSTKKHFAEARAASRRLG